MNIALNPPDQKKSFAVKFALILCLIAISIAVASWFFLGNLSLKNAYVLDSGIEIRTEVEGTVANISVSVGQVVAKDDTLLSLKSDKLYAEMKKEEAQLAVLKSALPASYATPKDIEDNDNALSPEERLAELIAQEREARLALEEASAAEGKAAVDHAKTKASTRTPSKVAYNEAKNVTAARKKAFEEISMARASVERDINRTRMLQQQGGYDAIPESARIKAYESQLAKVSLAASRLAATTIKSPDNGTISLLLATTGESVSEGQPVLRFIPSKNNTVTVVGELTKSEAQKAYIGQVCEIRIPSVGEAIFSGKIISMQPKKIQQKNATNQENELVTFVYVQVDQTGFDGILPANASAEVLLFNQR